MNSTEIIEQKLGEAQHRRNQVLTILNSVADATRPNQPKPSFSVSGDGGSASSANGGATSSIFSNKMVFAGDDRSLTNLYRAHRFQAPPPLCDVSSLRVDDLVTAFLRYRRSLHHLCYHGAQCGENDGEYENRNNANGAKFLAVNQMSEVGVLQQRIDKVRYECFVMLEQLRDAAVNGVISMDTTTTTPTIEGSSTINSYSNNNNNNNMGLTDPPEITVLRQSIQDEKQKLKEALSRLTIANYVPQPF